VPLRVLSERFEYLFGVIPTTPIRDQAVAEQLADLVRIESERGELDFHQKVRAVDTFYRYLCKERTLSKTAGGPDLKRDSILLWVGGWPQSQEGFYPVVGGGWPRSQEGFYPVVGAPVPLNSPTFCVKQ
jgi:hypothetical protein